jgi:hypothetical protein
VTTWLPLVAETPCLSMRYEIACFPVAALGSTGEATRREALRAASDIAAALSKAVRRASLRLGGDAI